jgi:hypothetical protein
MSQPQTSLQEIWEAILHSAFCLSFRLRHRSLTAVDFTEFHRRLQGSPLPCDEFATACQRIRNVQTYFVAKEYGAAEYELLLLTRSLKRHYCREKSISDPTSRLWLAFEFSSTATQRLQPAWGRK